LQAIHMSTSAALPELTGHDDADLLIGDVARLSGLSIDTLRYYDRAGLLGAVHRDGGWRRVFDRDTLGLLDVVLRLRRTGMPVKDVRHFVDMVRLGDTERAGRLDLLRAHRRRVLARLDELHDDLAVIDWKIAVYQAGEDGTDPPPPPLGWPRPQGHLTQPDALTAEPSTDQE
jgi:DNA-binding transcriptional MerR regulator